MDISSLLPFIVIALVAFVALRVILGAIKSSLKLAMWAIIAFVVLSAGFLAYQNHADAGAGSNLPTLSIPSSAP